MYVIDGLDSPCRELSETIAIIQTQNTIKLDNQRAAEAYLWFRNVLWWIQRSSHASNVSNTQHTITLIEPIYLRLDVVLPPRMPTRCHFYFAVRSRKGTSVDVRGGMTNVVCIRIGRTMCEYHCISYLTDPVKYKQNKILLSTLFRFSVLDFTANSRVRLSRTLPNLLPANEFEKKTRINNDVNIAFRRLKVK